jgi:7,8-dihydropterin-6-yl-methyl-4-(beta-D-ribofuranosyl)aminobenzene 5'-phosphate synthase
MDMKNKKIKLTIIIDNYVRSSGLRAEHGWSIMIENGNEKILFDTGASSLILNNMRYLGFEPRTIDKIFISHGHYDHTGGLYDITKEAGKKIEIIAHENIFEKKYKVTTRLRKKYIGIPYSKKKYIENGAEFIFGRDSIRISENIYSLGEIERTVKFEKPELNMIKKKNGIYMNDSLIDDTGIIIETLRGNVLITGCAHRGIINMIKQAQRLSGKDSFFAIIGGLHLFNKDKKYMDKVISELRKISIDRIIPSHCTGYNGYFEIKKEFGPKCEFGYAGKEIIL